MALEPLDHVVKRADLGRVDLIKLDAEGAELAILEGASETLQKDHPTLLLEINSRSLQAQGASPDRIGQSLATHRYRLFTFGSSGPLQPLEAIDVDGCNIVAVHPSRAESVRALMDPRPSAGF